MANDKYALSPVSNHLGENIEMDTFFAPGEYAVDDPYSTSLANTIMIGRVLIKVESIPVINPVNGKGGHLFRQEFESLDGTAVDKLIRVYDATANTPAWTLPTASSGSSGAYDDEILALRALTGTNVAQITLPAGPEYPTGTMAPTFTNIAAAASVALERGVWAIADSGTIVNGAGDAYIVGATPVGNFTALTPNDIAVYSGTPSIGWQRVAPVDGMTLTLRGTPNAYFYYQGSISTWHRVSFVLPGSMHTNGIINYSGSNAATGVKLNSPFAQIITEALTRRLDHVDAVGVVSGVSLIAEGYRAIVAASGTTDVFVGRENQLVMAFGNGTTSPQFWIGLAPRFGDHIYNVSNQLYYTFGFAPGSSTGSWIISRQKTPVTTTPLTSEYDTRSPNTLARAFNATLAHDNVIGIRNNSTSIPNNGDRALVAASGLVGGFVGFANHIATNMGANVPLHFFMPYDGMVLRANDTPNQVLSYSAKTGTWTTSTDISALPNGSTAPPGTRAQESNAERQILRDFPIIGFAGTPTGSEAVGSRYVVSSPATGAFLGQVDRIATLINTPTTWVFDVAYEGQRLLIPTPSVEYISFANGVWNREPRSLLGIDATQRTWDGRATANVDFVARQQRPVITSGNNTPAISPSHGDRHIVGTAPTGLWSAFDNRVVQWDGTALPSGAWTNRASNLIGDEVFSVSANGRIRWSGTAWVPVPNSGVSVEGSNRVLNIDKPAIGDQAIVRILTAGSGRAEIGTAGDDALRMKVSTDGTVWRDAIVVNPATGVVTLPLTPTTAVRTNLLINGDFTINQRSFAFGALAASAYGVDRWRAQGASDLSWNASTRVITINSGAIQQIIEPSVWGFSNLASTLLTVSVDGLTGGNLTVQAGTSSGVITPGGGRRSVTLTTAAGDTGNIVIRFTPTSYPASFSRAKCEIGSVATEWESRALQTEQTLCYRYYRRTSGVFTLIFYPTVAGGYFFNTMILSVPMRIAPTCTRDVTASGNIFAGDLGNVSVIPQSDQVVRMSIRAATTGESYANIDNVTFSAEL